MLSNPSLSWQVLQNVYYSLRPCYESLSWDVTNVHANHRVRLNQCVTLVALTDRFVPHPNVIDVYTVSGNKAFSVIYNSHASDHIVDYAFRGEQLVVLLNQKFRLYRDFKGTFTEHCFTKDLITLTRESSTPLSEEYHTAKILNLEDESEVDEVYVTACTVCDRYLILTAQARYIVVDLETLVNYELPTSMVPEKVHSMVPYLDDDKLVLVVGYDASVVSLKVDTSTYSYEYIDHQLTDGPFSFVSVSPNRSLVALFNLTQLKLFVVNSLFSQVLLEYDASSSPHQVEWCGSDAIVLSLRDEVMLVGPGQQSISFFYLQEGSDDLASTIPIIHTQPDGLKVLTSSKLELLARVDEATVNLHQIGSSHPGSILLDCVDNLLENSSKSSTKISMLKSDGSLLDAINECLKASHDEFNPAWQKKILKAISFAKSYVDSPSYDADLYLKALNHLKILNHIRSADIGLFLTYPEVEHLGWEEVVRMLLWRDQHYLAIKITDILGLRNLRDIIYTHWCSYKIRKELSTSDVELFKTIAHKLLELGPKNYVSVEEIATTAFEEGRIALCKLLINLEPKISARIGLLLKYEQVELALINAFQSGDHDSCQLILLELQKKLPLSEFFKVLNQNEQKTLSADVHLIDDERIQNSIRNNHLRITGDLISNFWENTVGKNSTTLDVFFRQEDFRARADLRKLKDFWAHPTDDDDAYYEVYKSKLVKLSKVNRTVYNYEVSLLELKKRLTETYQRLFYSDKTLVDVLRKLVEMNQLKQLQKVSKEFKVSQQKLWHLVVQTLAKQGEFTRLHTFISDHGFASPIGFSAIVDTCVFYGAPQDQISTYIEYCQDVAYTKRVELYILNGDYLHAAEEAYNNKDVALVQKIHSKTQALQLQSTSSTIKTYLTRLGAN